LRRCYEVNFKSICYCVYGPSIFWYIPHSFIEFTLTLITPRNNNIDGLLDVIVLEKPSLFHRGKL